MASVEQVQGSETTADEVVNTVVEEGARLGVKRFFTIPGRDPFDEIEWETRDAIIPGRDGPAFEQRGVEFPKFWSQTATNIVAQKYFRGRLSSPEREASVKQMLGLGRQSLSTPLVEGAALQGRLRLRACLLHARRRRVRRHD